MKNMCIFKIAWMEYVGGNIYDFFQKLATGLRLAIRK